MKGNRLTKSLAIKIYMCKLHIASRNAVSPGKKFKGQSAVVAHRFKVSAKTVRDVWNHSTWKHATSHLWEDEPIVDERSKGSQGLISAPSSSMVIVTDPSTIVINAVGSAQGKLRPASSYFDACHQSQVGNASDAYLCRGQKMDIGCEIDDWLYVTAFQRQSECSVVDRPLGAVDFDPFHDDWSLW
jgi:hypothetical protein